MAKEKSNKFEKFFGKCYHSSDFLPYTKMIEMKTGVYYKCYGDKKLCKHSITLAEDGNIYASKNRLVWECLGSHESIRRTLNISDVDLEYYKGKKYKLMDKISFIKNQRKKHGLVVLYNKLERLENKLAKVQDILITAHSESEK